MSETKARGSCILRIKGMHGFFKAAEERLADYVLQNYETVVNLTIEDLAKCSDTSYATVTRFCKKLGYDGYKDFKSSLIQDALTRQNSETLQDDLSISLAQPLESICDSTYRFFIRGLEESLSILDYNLIEQAVTAMMRANTICFVGTGTSGICARYACSRFFRIGLPCVWEGDSTLYRMRVATLRKGDVLFAISASGRSNDIVKCAQLAQKNGALVVSLSDFAISPLTKASSINLFTTPRIASLYQNLDMPLVINQIALIDTLYACCCSKNPEHASGVYADTRLASVEEKMKL